MNGAFTVFLALQIRIYSICVLNTIPKFLTILDHFEFTGRLN